MGRDFEIEMISSEQDTVITVEGLTKRYNRRYVVRDLTLEVKKGDIFGLLGPNGAGKSTVIRMLLGLVWPDAGSVSILGHNLLTHRSKALAHVGAIIETPSFYEYLSARQNLKIIGQLSGSVTDRMIDEVIEIVGLKGRDKDKVEKYSYGMKQRLGIALALLPKPALVILDEPTNGLDPHGMKDVRELLKSLPGMLGVTVFLSSHLLYEVEQICNRVAILNKGGLLIQGEMSALINEDRVYNLKVDDIEKTGEFLSKEPSVSVVSCDNSSVKLKLLKGDISDINSILVNQGIKVKGVILEKKTLEDVFMELTDSDIS